MIASGEGGVATCWVASAVLLSVASGQGPVSVSELDAAGMLANKIKLQRQEDRVVVVEWGELKIALNESTTDCAVGLTASGKELFILAGGVGTSLDLYFVQKDGERYWYPTGGGRRLPRKFNGNTGSWPAVEGRHLVLFAFEKDAGLEFRALNFAGRLLTSRRLPLKIDGWKVLSDPDAGAVRVQFGEGIEPIAFRHPLGPRLEFSPPGPLEFGKVQVGSHGRRVLYMSNTGQRPVRLKAQEPERGFTVMGKVPKELAPGARHKLLIDFAPGESGSFVERLKIFASGPVPEHLVVLRGEGLERPDAAVAGAAAAGKGAVEKSPREEPPPDAPRVAEAHFYPRGDDRVLVLGRVETPTSTRVALKIGAVRKVAAVDTTGRFHATVEAKPGTKIVVAALDPRDRRSPSVDLGVVPPMLAVDKTHVQIRCLPGEKFWLTVSADDSVVRTFVATADASGRGRVPLRTLGTEDGPELQLRVAVREDRQRRVSRTVRVGSRK